MFERVSSTITTNCTFNVHQHLLDRKDGKLPLISIYTLNAHLFTSVCCFPNIVKFFQVGVLAKQANLADTFAIYTEA